MANKTRTKKVTFRLTEEEFKTLKEKVSLTHYSCEEYLRIRAIYSKGVLVLPDKEFKEIRRLLLSISNNINQIAYKANAIGHVDAERYAENHKQLENVCRWLLEIPLLIEEQKDGTV